MDIANRFSGCILCGAIGDAYGSSYENNSIPFLNKQDIFYPFGKPKKNTTKWQITDDTQLTLATCEAMTETKSFRIENFADKYLCYFKKGKLSGIGSSTLKALKELEAGGHWSQVGRRGEFAAGNGAAMRIAPLAFSETTTKSQIRELTVLTHNNDEAYTGALCVWYAIRSIINGTWTGKENLIEIIIHKIPDTKLRDRLEEIKNIKDLSLIGNLGNNGYVVNSIPLAIAAANNVLDIGIEKMFRDIIDIGGDTDTNASIAGQIAGTLIGKNKIPDPLIYKLKRLDRYSWIQETIKKFINNQKL